MTVNIHSAKDGGAMIHDDFVVALQSADAVLPAGLIGPDWKPSARRFSVYRNNVHASLIEALGDNFPVVKLLVGEDFFNAMAQVYVRQNLPKVPMLFRYGGEFADFLAGFEPVLDLPYLPDAARVEWAWLQAFHAADIAPMTDEALAAIAPERLHEALFEAHPASAVLSSAHPVVTVVANHKRGDDCSGIDFSLGEDALITRPDVGVELRMLPRGGPTFLCELMNGETLGTAAERAAALDLEFDLATNIAGMIEAGVFASVAVPERTI